MTDNRPLKGLFNSQQFLFIDGERSQEELKLLGYFGFDLDESKHRAEAQRKTLSAQQSSSTRCTTILTLQEAFFLNHSLGCLSIYQDSKIIDIQTCWKSFIKVNPKFELEYAVYYYFRTRGWVVKDGSVYGVLYLLYKEGPSLDHARYAVVLCENQSSQSLLTHFRVVQSVKKELMLVFIQNSNCDQQITPQNLRNLKIITRLFTAQPNHIDQSM